MRTLYAILGALFVLMLVMAGAGAWMVRGVHDRHAARAAELEQALPQLRQARLFDADTACVILEHHLLTRPTSPALAVDCSAAKIDLTGEDVVLLTGTVFASSVDNALFGGGFGTPHCLARTADGWAVVGTAHELDGCSFDAEPHASAERLAAVASDEVDARRRAMAEHAIFGVHQALARKDMVPPVCEGLEPASGRAVGMLDRDLWAEPSLGDDDRFWRSLCSPAFLACEEGTEPTQFSLGCGLMEPWRYVLVLDQATKDAPQAVSDDQFIGGRYRATLKLIDMSSPRVLCARPMEVSLDGTVLLAPGEWIQGHYHERIKAELCAEVEALTLGQVAIDPYWGCD